MFVHFELLFPIIVLSGPQFSYLPKVKLIFNVLPAVKICDFVIAKFLLLAFRKSFFFAYIDNLNTKTSVILHSLTCEEF